MQEMPFKFCLQGLGRQFRAKGTSSACSKIQVGSLAVHVLVLVLLGKSLEALNSPEPEQHHVLVGPTSALPTQL